MTQDPLPVLLALALRTLVEYVNRRDDSFTDNDDVRALEEVAYVLNQVAPEDAERLRSLLGSEMSARMGLSES